MRRALPATVTLLLLSAAALPQDRPDSPEQAAEKVLTAFRAGDTEELEALAEREKPDAWLVADELCSRGEHDAAAALAASARRPDTEKLPSYLKSLRGTDPPACHSR